MKLNFCTLFNSSYLSRGLVMYESLLRHCADFHLYVYAFDEDCYQFLNEQNYGNLTVVSLTEFEEEDLLRVKQYRTAVEYCWTCSASIIKYSIEAYSLDNCTYIDADMQFFGDPLVLIEEMGDNSVLITEHRYTPTYDQSEASGKYCVQFVTFKNDKRGMEVLNWWRGSCIDWCYARIEDGKFGDQKYLDEFTTRFKGVYELKHLGGGVAPWNMQQYSFSNKNDKLYGFEIATGKTFELVFFHFHGLKFYENDIVLLTGTAYDMNLDVKELLFKPYVKLLNEAKKNIMALGATFNPSGSAGKSPYKPMSLLWMILFYGRDLFKNPVKNILGAKLKYRIAHHYYLSNKNI